MLSEPRTKAGPERIHTVQRNIVEQTFRYGGQERDLSAQCQRRKLRLAQHCTNAPSMLNNLAGALVDHRAEAGKYFEFEELRVFEPETFGERLQNWRLRLAADTRDTFADIDRG